MTFSCYLLLADWRKELSIDSFLKENRLIDVHKEHFYKAKKNVLNIISELEMNKEIGEGIVKLKVTGKSLFGLRHFTWKEKTFLEKLQIKLSDKFQFEKWKINVEKEEFNPSVPIRRYTDLLNYINQQGKSVIGILKEKSVISEPAYPDFKPDYLYAGETLCKVFPEFRRGWNKVSSSKLIWFKIVRILGQHKTGVPLQKKDEDMMDELKNKFENLLETCSNLQREINSYDETTQK